MRLLPDRIFAERQVVNDAGIIQLDQMAVENPTESIHQSSHDVQPQDMTGDDSNENTYIHPVSMDSVFLILEMATHLLQLHLVVSCLILNV